MLVSPHVFAYDLILFMPALLIVADWSVANPLHRSSPIAQLLLGLAFMSPFLGPFAEFTRIQLSVVSLLALLLLLTRLEADSDTEAHFSYG